MMNLKRECNEVGLSVDDFCQLIDVPYQTLAGWAKSRPVLLEVIFNGLACNNILDRMEELRNEANEQSMRIQRKSPLQAVNSCLQDPEGQ